MNRLSALERTEKFVDKAIVKKLLGHQFQLSSIIQNEIMNFWNHWLHDNPKREVPDNVYFSICMMINSGELQFYERFLRLKTLKPQTLDHYQTLYGHKIGSEKFHAKAKTLSDTKIIETIDDKVDAFFQLKRVRGQLDKDCLSDLQMSELRALLDSRSWSGFKDKHQIIIDLILFHQPNYIQRLDICEKNSKNYNSIEYLNARYGGDLARIAQIREAKSNHASKNFPNSIEYWQRLGYSELESKNLVHKVQKSRAKKSGKHRKPKQRKKSQECEILDQ